LLLGKVIGDPSTNAISLGRELAVAAQIFPGDFIGKIPCLSGVVTFYFLKKTEGGVGLSNLGPSTMKPLESSLGRQIREPDRH